MFIKHFIFKAAVCKDDEFFCGEKCIESERVCDGRPDCADYRDEYNCTVSTTTFKPVSFQPNLQMTCPEDECADGTCIFQYQRCNGQRDCAEGEDETGCRKYIELQFQSKYFL